MDETDPKLYECPRCGEQTKAIYNHPRGGGSCFECLKESEPAYAKMVRESEKEHARWKSAQKKK